MAKPVSAAPNGYDPIVRSAFSTQGTAASGNIEPAETGVAAESNVGEESEAGRLETRPPDRKQRQAKRRYSSPLDGPRTWLMDDPSRWPGRRVRNRRTGTLYLIRQVFKSGRVELEKSWMTYLTNVATVRAEYETYA